MTASQAAQKWNISHRRIQVLCAEGRIKNVFKLGNAWAIPDDAEKPRDTRCKNIDIKRLNVIDLFSGCGGFSKGFEMAGFNIALGLDSWSDSIETFQANFVNAHVVNRDITGMKGKDLLRAAGLKSGQIDVIIGGPPCQGFSLSGKRMLDDPRNRLYKSFVDIVADIKPKVFVMENVPGLIRLFGGRVKNEVIEDFSRIGYKVSMEQLTASDFGVPQHRRRVFFVGINPGKIKKTSIFSFPEPTHGTKQNPFITSYDAISDLDFISDEFPLSEQTSYELPPKSEYQEMMRSETDILMNHVATIHTPKTKQIISMVSDGGNYKELPKELHHTRKVNIAWTRMNSKKPCFTIDTGHNHHFHYRANRVPTARESARIQSFPDDFIFKGIKTSQLKQIGNAVPPLLAREIASVISDIIKKG